MGGRWTVVGFVVIGSVVAGCGSSGSSTASTTSPAESTAASTVASTGSTVAATNTTLATVTTTASTVGATDVAATTTSGGTAAPESTAAAVNTGPVDPQSQARALAGTLQATDFPEPWVQFSPAAETPISTGSCSYRPGGAVTLVAGGGSQSGPTMQYRDSGAFASSFAVDFPDAATAQDYIAVVNSDEWAQCRAAQLQQTQADNGSDAVVKVATRQVDTLGQNGFESYAEFDLEDSGNNVIRVVLFSFYRLDRTVIGVTQEYGAISDADNKAFFDDTFNALTAAYARVNAAP